MVIGGRYRMIGLLGRGGMGVVYRADDLKLDQPVALKFLPADVERDPERLERFLGEVRTSLKVTHPNVCRVFDLGEIEGRHFLSMEYVDGEDLASLLRRIGRLPEDKAVVIARQLCAGLAAAHDEGVLHRDLKPANIMIDGRGRAKITDFGLAGAADAISGAEARAGTPQYMAPEQVSGGKLDERTDLYALGLVLYELFTGRRAFAIRNLDDLQRLQTSTPTSPSSHVSGLDPLVERAILRCLEPDPARRPPSAAALAAALPGGDPLAMAIAAGDTPSPEMVAAAGSDAGLRPKVAWLLVGTTVVFGIVAAWLGQHVSVTRLGAPTRPPEVMIERAREIIRTAGLSASPLDHAWGLFTNVDYLNHAETKGPVGSGDRVETQGVRFWYRESPIRIERMWFLNPELTPRVGPTDPPLQWAGDVGVVLDREGRLQVLEAVPPQRAGVVAAASAFDWSVLFRAAGLDPAEWISADSEWTPRVFGDRRHAWVPRDSTRISPARVEAAALGDHPVSFHLIHPWTIPYRDTATRRTESARAVDLIFVLIFTAIMAGSAFVARRNLRLDRADRRGAVRVGVFAASLLFGVWLLEEHHVATIWELYLFLMAAGWALFVGVLLAAIYLALEPYVRRTWPTIVISWSRVMGGVARDPLVASDVLVGCAAGGVIATLFLTGSQFAHALSGVLPRLITSPRPFFGVSHVVPYLANGLVTATFYVLALLFLLFVLRRVLRREWAAILVGALLIELPHLLAPPIAAFPLMFTTSALTFLLLARVGLVATIAAVWVDACLQSFPFTWPADQWYSGVGLTGIVAVGALAIVAFRIATAPHAAASRQVSSANAARS